MFSRIVLEYSPRIKITIAVGGKNKFPPAKLSSIVFAPIKQFIQF